MLAALKANSTWPCRACSSKRERSEQANWKPVSMVLFTDCRHGRSKRWRVRGGDSYELAMGHAGLTLLATLLVAYWVVAGGR